MSEKRVILSSVSHETGESWAVVNTTPGAMDRTGQVLYVGTGNPAVSIQCVAGDKADWTELDTLLAFDATKGGIGGDPVPILVMLGKQDPAAVQVATFVEGALSAQISYDPAARIYHLWYSVYGWSQEGGEIPSGRVGLASKLYDGNKATTFNPSSWWVIPFRFDQFGPFDKAQTVLLHCAGVKRNYYYGDNSYRTYLVFSPIEKLKYTDPLDNDGNNSCCVDIVKVTSSTPNETTGWYPGALQTYDLVTRTWTTGEKIWVVDVNA